MKIKRRLLLIIALALVGAGAAYAATTRRSAETNPKPLETAVKKVIEQLPKHSDTPPALRVAADLTPPTNSWLSSVVFAATDQPLFAYPLTYKPGASIQEIGTQTFTATDNTMMGVHDPTIKVSLQSSSYRLDSYDDMSGEIAYLDRNGRTVAKARVTHGSPYVFITPVTDQAITITTQAATTTVRSNEQYEVMAGNKRFGIYISGASTTRQGETITINATKSTAPIAVFAIPAGAEAASYFNLARNPVTGSSVTYSTDSGSIITTYRLTTSNNRPTYFATLPHQGISAAQPYGTFDGLYGKQSVLQGNEFKGNVAKLTPAATLDIASLSPTEKDTVRAALVEDVAATILQKTDTYFGGKELYRAANLLLLAEQLGMKNEQTTMQTKLREAFDTWLTPKGANGTHTIARSFYYDPTIKGVVGTEPSFGSEQFNDHHFHYSYFIYAASILARTDTAFATKHGPMIDTLIADIASQSTSTHFPKQRVFDSYLGHSWASGYADFGDGNNQESSSEAINAWSALYQWGTATKNTTLQQQALWLYGQEVASTKAYWLSSTTQNDAFTPYTHTISVLNWGGKRDYATFFSPRPQAMLGIQLIPLSPGHQSYLSTVPTDKRQRHLQEAAATDEDYAGQFGDYLWMYRALNDRDKAIAAAQSLPDTDIDDANSRAYLYAWIYSSK